MDEFVRAQPERVSGKAEFDDPLGLLLKCHGRIELQLTALEAAVAAIRDGSDDDVRRAFGPVDAAVGHFAVTGARHTEDEEESLFPVFARVAPSPSHLSWWRSTCSRASTATPRTFTRSSRASSRQCAVTAVAWNSEVEQFCECVTGLVDVYRPHIRLENEVVFPAAAALLAPDEIALVGAEMRARRSVTRIGLGRRSR